MKLAARIVGTQCGIVKSVARIEGSMAAWERTEGVRDDAMEARGDA